jgi:hypothetical protein
MEDAFKFPAGGGIRKNNPGQFVAPQPAAGRNDVFAESVLDFSEGGFAGLNKLPRKFVGVHHRHAPSSERFCRSGFTHAHAAGQTPDFHRLACQFYGAATAR